MLFHGGANREQFDHPVLEVEIAGGGRESGAIMLILTRKLGESIRIGDDIEITFLEARGRQIKVGVKAPHHVTVHRAEVYDLIREQNRNAAQLLADELPDALDRLHRIIVGEEEIGEVGH